MSALSFNASPARLNLNRIAVMVLLSLAVHALVLYGVPLRRTPPPDSGAVVLKAVLLEPAATVEVQPSAAEQGDISPKADTETETGPERANEPPRPQAKKKPTLKPPPNAKADSPSPGTAAETPQAPSVRPQAHAEPDSTAADSIGAHSELPSTTVSAADSAPGPATPAAGETQLSSEDAAPEPSNTMGHSNLAGTEPVRTLRPSQVSPDLGHGLRASKPSTPSAPASETDAARSETPSAISAAPVPEASPPRPAPAVQIPRTVANIGPPAAIQTETPPPGAVLEAPTRTQPAPVSRAPMRSYGDLSRSAPSSAQTNAGNDSAGASPTPTGPAAPAAEAQQAIATPPPSPEPTPAKAPPQLSKIDPAPAPLAQPEAPNAVESPHSLPVPAEGTISYIARLGILSAKAALSWQIVNDRYKLNLAVRGTGIAALAGQYTQVSEGRVGTRGLVPVSFAAESMRRKDTASFDWANRQLTLVSKKGASVVELPDNTQDTLSVIFQLAFEPPQATTQSTRVTNGRKLATYAWQIVGEERLTLESGSFNTLRIARQRSEKEDGLEIWLSVEHHYLPVKILFLDKKGSTDLQLVVSSIQIANAGVKN